MKIKEVQEEKDIILRLNELGLESDPEFSIEQDDQSLTDEQTDGGFTPTIEEENAEDLDKDASHSQNDIKKDLINDADFEESNRSNLAGLQVDTEERSEKNGEDKDESPAESQEEAIDLSDSSSNTLEEVLEEILLGYHNFIDNAVQTMEGGEEKREELYMHRLHLLLHVQDRVSENLNKGLKIVDDEMERLKINENETEEDYFNKRPYIRKIFSKLLEINATISGESSSSVEKLNGYKEELDKLISIIRILKAKKIATTKE